MASYYFDEETTFDICTVCHKMLPENEFWYGLRGLPLPVCEECSEKEEVA